MTDIENLVRPNIRTLKPYASARDEYAGKQGIFLDANENPFGKLNRYPDPHQKKLKKKLSRLKNVPDENIFIGNGSDEVIDLAFRIFCNPGKDTALTFSPTYGMYAVSAAINDIGLVSLPLDDRFQINRDMLNYHLRDENLKLIFICSPNNPTGNSLDNINYILDNFKGIVFVDEAYIDFSSHPSWVDSIHMFPNLIVSQTFSKAWGLAAARVGTMYASAEIIKYFDHTKPPYNVSSLNQKAALKALDDIEIFEKRKQVILTERDKLKNILEKLPIVKKVYPSDANFLLVQMTDADMIYQTLVKKKIITRNRNSLVSNCIRFTIGKPGENKKLAKALKLFV